MAKILSELSPNGLKNDLTAEKLLSLTLEDIDRVYVGKKNCCRCGCGGEYKDPEYNSVSVKRALNKLKKLISESADETYTITTDSTIAGGYVEFYLTSLQNKPLARCTAFSLKEREVKSEV